MSEEGDDDLDNTQKQDLLTNEIQIGTTDEPSTNERQTLHAPSPVVDEELQEDQKSEPKKSNKKKLPSSNVIPRECLEKEDWINLLATPSRKCPDKRPDNYIQRLHKLAKPPRHRIVATLENRGAKLPAPVIDRLMNILECDEHLTLEETEKLFQNPKKKKKKRKELKDFVDQDIIKPIKSNEDSKMSRDAIFCQYNIADTFVKSILQQKNTVVNKECLSDLSTVIQKRLNNIVDTLEISLDETGKTYHQISFLSKLIAKWIAEILEEVAIEKEEDLKRECDEKRKLIQSDDDDDSLDDKVVYEEHVDKSIEFEKEKNFQLNKDNNTDEDDDDDDDENDANDKANSSKTSNRSSVKNENKQENGNEVKDESNINNDSKGDGALNE